MSTINAATMGRLSDLPTAAARRTSSEQKEKMQSVIANAEPPPRGQVKADNDPENLYARITKNGKLIAEVYKSGAVVRPNSVDLPSLTNEASDPAELKTSASRKSSNLPAARSNTWMPPARQRKRSRPRCCSRPNCSPRSKLGAVVM